MTPSPLYTLIGFKGSGSAAVEVALESCGAAYRIGDAASSLAGLTLLLHGVPFGRAARQRSASQMRYLVRPCRRAQQLLHVGAAALLQGQVLPWR